MILGSGNVVHNLRQVRFDTIGKKGQAAAEWNVRFNNDIKQWMLNREWDKLVKVTTHPDFKMCNPTPDHFLPIMVVAGASSSTDQVMIVSEGYDGWSLSMLSITYVNSSPAE